MSDRHDYVPQEYRECTYRNKRIFASIKSYAPDIITLQEVTGKMYKNYIQLAFKRIGFDSLHIKKCKDSMQSDTILYRHNRFNLLNHLTISLGALSHQFDDQFFGPASTNNMFHDFLKSKHNQGNIFMFNEVHTQKQFIVCYVHLFWDTDRPHVKSTHLDHH